MVGLSMALARVPLVGGAACFTCLCWQLALQLALHLSVCLTSLLDLARLGSHCYYEP